MIYAEIYSDKNHCSKQKKHIQSKARLTGLIEPPKKTIIQVFPGVVQIKNDVLKSGFDIVVGLIPRHIDFVRIPVLFHH